MSSSLRQLHHPPTPGSCGGHETADQDGGGAVQGGGSSRAVSVLAWHIGSTGSVRLSGMA